MQKSALSRLVIAFWYRLNFEHKSNNIWHTKAIHVLILTPSFTIHPLYRETLQIFLNVSNILFKLTKKKIESGSPNYEALGSDTVLPLLSALAGNKKSKSPWICKWADFGLGVCNSPSPTFAAWFLKGDPTFMQKKKGFHSKQMRKVTIFISLINKLNYSQTYFHQDVLMEVLMHFLKSIPNRKLVNFIDIFNCILFCSVLFYFLFHVDWKLV